MQRLLSIVGTFCVLPAALAVAHPQWVIEYDLEPGLRYEFEQVTTTRLEMVIEAGGQQMDVTENSTQVATGWVEVVEVVEGVTRVARIYFGEGDYIESSSNLMPQPQRLPFELAGQTVLVTAGADGLIASAGVVGAGALPTLAPDTAELVRGLAIPDPALPPRDPVGVGDSWMTKLGHREDAIHPPYTFTVLELRSGEAARSVRLQTAAEFQTEQEGIVYTMDLAGEVLIDLGTGLPVESEMAGPMQVDGKADMGGGTMATIKGAGRIEQVMRVKYLEGRGEARPTSTVTKAAPSAAPAGAEGPEGWKVYSHALSNLTFMHPPDWRVEVSPSGLLIVPSDHDPARELLFGLGAPAGGETDATSAQVQQNLDALVQAQAPTLRRSGGPKAIEMQAGSGASYRYAGTLPDGRQAVCLMLVRILEDESAVLGILADEARAGQRSAVLQEMFGTIAARKPGEAGSGAVGDRRLIGMFQGEVLNANTEGVYMNTQLVYAFGADGRVFHGAQSMFTAHKRDHNDDLLWTASGGTDESVQSGKWTTEKGLLSIRWDDGDYSVFAYSFEPDGSLVFRDPYTKELINFYPRVR
ncbi:MAG: hypothetical protein ACF8NJ_06595 [Phycisphaerales bacterium JB038]